MSQQEAAARMRTIDTQILELQQQAIAAGANPMSSDEYGDLLADWLEAAWWFHCGSEQAA